MASRASAGAAAAGPRASPGPRGPGVTAKSTSDPILRNALRYTISAREYAVLHKHVISKSKTLRKRAPTVDAVQRIMDGEPQNRGRGGGGGGQALAKGYATSTGSGGGVSSSDKESKAKAKEEVLARIAGKGAGADDYNARAIRHSLRVFIATGALMKLWGIVSARVLGKKQGYVIHSRCRSRVEVCAPPWLALHQVGMSGYKLTWEQRCCQRSEAATSQVANPPVIPITQHHLADVPTSFPLLHTPTCPFVGPYGGSLPYS